MVQELAHELGEYLAMLQPIAVFVNTVGSQTGSSGESPTNQPRPSSRTFLKGWFVGTRASGEMYENSRP